jgi:uncharacterized protein
MLEKEIIKRVKNFAINNLSSDDIHGYGHTERVYRKCIKLGQKLGANLFVLKIAALLHDIGRYSEDQKYKNKNHAEISADIASNYLKTINRRFGKNNFINIIHCIQAHSFSNQITPNSLEAQILSDADKLDALGAIGLYRTIGYTIKMNGNLQDVILHLENKIFNLKNQLFLDISKESAEERLTLLNQFYQEVKEQLALK